MSPLLSSLPQTEVAKRLRDSGLLLNTGPFNYRIRTSLPAVCDGIYRLYANHPLPADDAFVDFDIRLDYPSIWRRRVRPKALFTVDHSQPFAPIAPDQAYAFLEWGMNWCVAQYSNRFLKLHASVLEKSGRALIMPGSPGAGKSTLCAALMLSGWRLLSDEFALISRKDVSLTGLCRPIGLKNESIDIISQRQADLVMGPPSRGTHKGTVVHLRASRASTRAIGQRAQAALILFPRYRAEGATRLSERLKETAFIKTAEQAFNYSLLGQEGFDLMSRLIERSQCYDLAYSDLDEAIATIDTLNEACDV